MDRRLQARYAALVKAHMASVSRNAAGPQLLPGDNTAAAATQAAWRFFNNDHVSLPALAEPLREAGRQAAARSASEFVLLLHDWCKLDYGRHASKKDLRQLTHQYDNGYDLTTALLVDAGDGQPLAPMQTHLTTAAAVHSTSATPPSADDHHLDQLTPTMAEAAQWNLPRRVVHVIDREADSLGHFREWDDRGHLFLVRSDDRRVLWNQEPWLISEIAEHFARHATFEPMGEALYRGRPAQQEVAAAEVVLHRPHKTRIDGKQHDIAGRPLRVRLIVTRLLDDQGAVLAQWTLLTNVPGSDVDAAQVARWYYWRWRIESFFKLLKSHGQELEHWQQETGLAIARRLLVAAMACVVVWRLERTDTPQAEASKQILIRLSGRSMKRGRPYTAPALLAGYMVLLSIVDLLDSTDCNVGTLRKLAIDSLPFEESS